MTEAEIDVIINKVDHDKNGYIEYSEFLTHSITHKQMSEKNVMMFYNIMKGGKNKKVDADNQE